MLPSTGYFKGISCPFYDSGLCERPYCHFRHVKKEIQNISNEGIENGAILQQLVSEAVKKVLQQTEAAGPSQSEHLLNQNDITEQAKNLLSLSSKVKYNPTPISELNKIINGQVDTAEETAEQKHRHIPVPYTPRKPANQPIKRFVDTNGSTKPFIYMPPTIEYTPGSTDNVKLDPYLPKGSVESKDIYLPGSEKEPQAYTPVETKTSNKLSYVPSDRSDQSNNKNKLLEYRPSKVTSQSKAPRATYQPTPLSEVPCFSSDEDEPVVKKQKCTDLNNLDGLESEFAILGEILDEEKSKESLDTKVCGPTGTHKSCSNVKKIKVNSEEKILSVDKKVYKDEPSSEKGKRGSKSKSSDRKSSHKSSSRDKERNKSRDKDTNDKKIHQSSSDSKISKNSGHRTSKSSNKSSSKDKKHSREENRKDKHKHDRKVSKEKHSSKERHKNKYDKSKESKSNSCDDHFMDDVTEELVDEISESDEESRALECKKIFEEYIPMEKVKNTEEVMKCENIDDEYIPTKKRISRTVDKNVKIIPRAPIKPDFKVNAAQTMAERLVKIREFHASKQTLPTHNETVSIKAKTETTKSNPISSSSNKIRIAHVPYASTMLNAKKFMSKPITTDTSSSTSSTIVQTIKKGSQRVAHIPCDKFIDRPGVLEPLASKIPANIRSTFLNKMIDESLKIYLYPADAYARAQHEELNTSKKCSTVQIYRNSAVLTVSRLRKEISECNGRKKAASECLTLQNLPHSKSHVTGSSASWSIESKNKMTDTTHEYIGAKFYNNISKWILTEEQLQENGFPRPHLSGDKGRAKIYVQNSKQKPPKGSFRTCSRCKKEYTINKKGFPAVKEECIYHPNNKYRFRGEPRYQCCSQDGTSDGCCVAPNHVYEYVDYDNLKGYVRTLPPEQQMTDYGIYALDCEMCYTTQGLDLTRVTVINSTCKVVYETLIKPLHPILDYNTRYSGITEEQMSDVSTTLLDVQATLLSMFTSKTILIGHSLESDFKALKLIHDTVIDTSVLFPHKMGPPFKRALRNLSSEYLKKIIQNSVDGHDSAEDATVCMELIHYKLKEDLKTR